MTIGPVGALASIRRCRRAARKSVAAMTDAVRLPDTSVARGALHGLPVSMWKICDAWSRMQATASRASSSP
ncbi:hypothetical protein [Sphingomonas sp. AP4-R1]|uniref:hypothetical protein n=1 Tax=Sphingomonas sp. AP4-R1 TaxID=2735134 RepID=UPI003462F799